MRLLITDHSRLLNCNHPIMEKCKDIFLVVCLEGERVTNRYECFVSPYQHDGEEDDSIGIASRKYQALQSVADELLHELDYHEEIVFLADGSPESLYPFHVLKNRNTYNSLHLCTMSPWNFEDRQRIKAHNELLSDLTHLHSILYLDSNDYLSKMDKPMTIEEMEQRVITDFLGPFPKIVNDIEDMHEISYFDFASNSYIPVSKGYDDIDLTKSIKKDTEMKIQLHRSHITLGLILSPEYPEEDESMKEVIEKTIPRIDGKKICNYLRELRLVLAKANGIEFVSDECPSIGPCGGTCPKCDRESIYLRDMLSEIPESKRCIPDYLLEEWEVL